MKKIINVVITVFIIFGIQKEENEKNINYCFSFVGI